MIIFCNQKNYHLYIWWNNYRIETNEKKIFSKNSSCQKCFMLSFKKSGKFMEFLAFYLFFWLLLSIYEPRKTLVVRIWLKIKEILFSTRWAPLASMFVRIWVHVSTAKNSFMCKKIYITKKPLSYVESKSKENIEVIVLKS